MDQKQVLAAFWEEQLGQMRQKDSSNWILKKKQLHDGRGKQILRMTGEGRILSGSAIDNRNKLIYQLSVTFFIKEGEFFYHEEEERTHEALIENERVVMDSPVTVEREVKEIPTLNLNIRTDGQLMRFSYDRRAAVQYAERWWNDYNPAYHQFSVDCTNYVSQCLRAGGAPMWGYPQRKEGWWYQEKSWSYSWAVAHSLRWYLSGTQQGLKGTEMEKASDLYPGDVICYDFEGNERWDHSTIVVAKDSRDMPLVNAHTDNSRHRYWSYEDSTAWTNKCRYKFFRIGE